MAVLVISYSRADQPQVRALVALLTSGLRGVERAVYWDERFEPGEPWFDQLKTHIDAAPQLFVFWCDHASTSEQVRREFTYALEQNKRVVPVLLDDTPLAAELAPIHGIDLRGAIRHEAAPGASASDPLRVPGRLRVAPARAALAVTAALMLVAASAIWWTLSLRGRPSPDQQDAGSSVEQPPTTTPDRGTLTPPSPPPAPRTRIVIDNRVQASPEPDELTPASRAQIDAMLRDAGAPGSYRIAINGRAGAGMDDRATRQRNEAIRRYIARQHGVPLERIRIDAEGAGADLPPGGTVVSVLPAQPPTPGDRQPRPPRPGARARAALLLLLATVGTLVAVLAVRRIIGSRRRRQSILREFERHLAES